ncbi:hypothetical protein BS47DRAFT_1388669 [Hydnum rufescens UP504]|uniref:F-box domain-containing protein n=1 Tax=Hydnum rufescens UP504 TaxID=1448309 RepID=A0A9P6B6P5_9AGAM|nr:hypothetical protein BS47DRAFT_1388669 [Hydnum rufescens UP504]
MSISHSPSRTRKQVKNEVIYNYNAAAPVNRLSPELVSAVFMEGLPERDSLQPAASWLQRLRFLVLISAVSGGWRRVALDTAPLWSFIMYQTGMSRAADVRRMKIIKEFILRSKEAIIDLTIVLDDDRQSTIGPKLRGAIGKRRLEFALALRSLVEDHSHRCRSFMLFASDTVMAGPFFPLPPRMPALTDLTIRTNSVCDGPNGPVISLFPEGMECQLRTMTIASCPLPEIESIDFCRVQTLTLNLKFLTSRSDEVLRLLSPFRNLRTLDIRGAMRPPHGPLLPITMPNITKITMVQDTQEGFLNSIIAPQLEHLALIGSAIPKSLGGSLRTLCLEFESLSSALPMIQSVASQTDLVAMHFKLTPACNSDVLQFLNGYGAGKSDLSVGTYALPCPSLEFVRILTTGSSWKYSFRHYKTLLAESLGALLERRPNLTLEIQGFGVNPGEVVQSWLDALVGDFGSRVCVLEDYSHPTPLSDLFSSHGD